LGNHILLELLLGVVSNGVVGGYWREARFGAGWGIEEVLERRLLLLELMRTSFFCHSSHLSVCASIVMQTLGL